VFPFNWPRNRFLSFFSVIQAAHTSTSITIKCATYQPLRYSCKSACRTPMRTHSCCYSLRSSTNPVSTPCGPSMADFTLQKQKFTFFLQTLKICLKAKFKKIHILFFCWSYTMLRFNFIDTSCCLATVLVVTTLVLCVTSQRAARLHRVQQRES